MKKLLLILALSLISMPTIPSNAITVNQKDMGFISVNTNETKEITPNTANITFSVETTDVDSKRATERNNQITTKVISALKQELASDKKSNIQTQNFNLRPNYKNNKESEENIIKNYTAVNTINVKTSDVSLVSKLIDTAVKNNVSKIGEVYFTIENQDSYATDITNEALLKAKQQANNIAATMKQKVVGIKSLRINVYQQGANGIRLYKAASDSNNVQTSTPIETGKSQLNVSINAEFYVK